MPHGLTRELAGFVSGLTFDRIPAAPRAMAHVGITDCVGTMIAGSVEEPTRILMETLAPARGEASLFLTGPRVTAPEAAWINGTAAHALDYDDVGMRGHPSTVLVPAILAEGERMGASGAEMLTAYVAGYETWGELVFRDPDQHHQKGWHPTGIFGAIAAAAAAARLNRLDADRTGHAIALGASQSAGLMANFGTMTKPFHAGRSAHAGVIAARLAKAGFTAAPDALEHPQGYLAAVSPHGAVDRTSPCKAGIDWRLMSVGLSVKKYPMCFGTHRALDGMLDLLAANPVRAGEIKSITVSTGRRNFTILRNSHPQTGLEAKFSMQFAMAAAVVAGRAGLGELTDAFVRRGDIQALMQKVTVVPDDRVDPVHNGHAPYDLVTIELGSGRTLESARVSEVRGSPERPLQRDELWTKFEDCIKVGNPELNAPALFERLMSLERQPSVAALTSLPKAA